VIHIAKLTEGFQRELNEAIGFRKVIDALIEAKKPLLGHNMMLDLLHLFACFGAIPAVILTNLIFALDTKISLGTSPLPAANFYPTCTLHFRCASCVY